MKREISYKSQQRRWAHMINRCTDPNHKDFPYYGARGIRVCNEWLNSFNAFNDYTISLPHAHDEGYTLDRIDNDGNYEPGNIQWSTRRDQVMNRRKQKNNTSGYTGVCHIKGKYRSRIKINGKFTEIGNYNSAINAAKARDEYIIQNKLNEYKLQVYTT